MKKAAVLLLVALAAGCRGEPVPRDYQSSPPGSSNPADDKSEAPTTDSSNQAAPEPSYGAEGTSGQYKEKPSEEYSTTVATSTVTNTNTSVPTTTQPATTTTP